MLNRSASLAMSTSVLKALPGKLDIKRHSPSILYTPITELGSVSMMAVPEMSVLWDGDRSKSTVPCSLS